MCVFPAIITTLCLYSTSTPSSIVASVVQQTLCIDHKEEGLMMKSTYKLSSTTKRIVLIVSANMFVALVCALFLMPRGETNDDLFIHMLTTDRAYGSVTPYIGHIGIPLAWLMIQLQRIFPAYNCFMLLEYLLTLVAFTSLSLVMTAYRPDYLGHICASVLVLCYAPYYYTQISFTRNAILLGLTGLFVVLWAIEQEKIKYRALLVGALLCLLGSQLRLQAFLAGAAFAAVCIFFSLFKRLKLRRALAAFGIIAIAVTTMAIFERIAFARDPVAAAYWRYSQARSSLVDYPLPSYYEHIEEYQQLGVSPNDLQLIIDWSFGDLEYFDVQTLESIVDMQNRKTILDAFMAFASSIPSKLLPNPYFLCAVVFLFPCLALCRRLGLLQMLALAVGFVASFVYLYTIGRATVWVMTGIFTCLAASLMHCLCNQDRKHDRVKIGKKLGKAFFAVTTVAAMLFGTMQSISFVELRIEQDIPSRLEAYEILAQDSSSLYIVERVALADAYRYVPFYSSIPEGFFSNIYFIDGWDTNSAPKNSILSRYNISSPYRALVEYDNVFLLDAPYYAEKLTFIREHIDPSVCCSMVNLVDGFYVLSFSPLLETEDTHFATPRNASGRYYSISGFYCISVDVDLPVGTTVCYLELTDPAGSRGLYRAITSDSGLYVLIPNIDMSHIGIYEVRVTIKQGDRLLRSAESVMLQFG